MKKRLISIITLVLLLATLLPIVSAGAMIGPQYVSTSNGKGLYMRTGPSKNDAIIVTIPYGAQVDSYDYYNNTWAYVSYRGNYGYCMSRYFSSTKPGTKPSGGGGETTTDIYKGFSKVNYYVTVRPSTPSGYVNLRWAPTKAHGIQSTYYAGYQLQVISQNGTWAQVYDEATSTCGFIMRSFLSETGVGAAY